jgi:hypothetical protein
MVLRFVAYWSLGIDGAVKGAYIPAVLCFIIPFAGPTGMWLAICAAFLFFFRALYIAGAIALAVLAFNLIGNDILCRHQAVRMFHGFQAANALIGANLRNRREN